MKTYGVLVPIAGHAYISVEANSEEDAIEKAMVSIDKNHIESWDTLKTFTRGNVCMCPTPHKIEVTIEDDDN